MFRFFESLVDPYGPYRDTDAPPNRFWPYILAYVRPARWVLVWTTLAILAVAIIEILLIWYAGRLVDLLGKTEPGALWSRHGIELGLVAVFILFLRPLIQTLSAAFLNQSLMPNLGTLVRWRSHRHVLRQSVGWFQNDFAGRIANRLMQTAPAVVEATFQTFDALVYAAIYLIGALWLLSDTDARLAAPLAVWLVLYVWLVTWTIPRVGAASEAFSDARSAITGRIVDSYTNIQSVKLFAHTRSEEAYAGEAIETARQAFARQMRIFTLMDLGLTVINGFLIVAVIGYALYLWQVGIATIGTVAAASALTLRLNAMTGWIMWSLSSLFQNVGVIKEGMETITAPIELKDAPTATQLAVTEGEVVFDNVSHHYGRGSGGLDRVSLTIRPGERVGLVGRSGAGKSTLVNLILRFFDTEGGALRIDGQDVRAVTQDSLRRQIGMVTQDPSLLHRSVRENILYGRPDATEAEMVAAAKLRRAQTAAEAARPFAERMSAVLANVAAGVAGVAGGLLAQTTGFASLDLFALDRSADLMLMLVIGGTGWLWGGIAGAIVFKLMHNVISSITPQYWTFWIGLFLVVLVVVGRDRLLRPWTWWGKGRAS